MFKKKNPIFLAVCVFTMFIILAIALMSTAGASYVNFDIQAQSHQRANQARLEGAKEDDPRILTESDIWWKAQNEFLYDCSLLATAVYQEAWGGCSTAHRETMAGVVYNRLNSPYWPKSIYNILAAPKQYSKSYVTPGSEAWLEARANPTNWAECMRIAEKALRGQVKMPYNVVYQSNSSQGKIYATYKTNYSTTYFCYGKA